MKGFPDPVDLPIPLDHLRVLASRLRGGAALVQSEVSPVVSMLDALDVSGRMGTHVQDAESRIRSSAVELQAALSEAAAMIEAFATQLEQTDASVASAFTASAGDLKLVLEATGATVAVGSIYLRAKVVELARRAQERGADVEINLRAGIVRIWNQPEQEAEEMQRQLAHEQRDDTNDPDSTAKT